MKMLKKAIFVMVGCLGWATRLPAQEFLGGCCPGIGEEQPLQARAGVIFLERPSPTNRVPVGSEEETTWLDLDLGWAAGPEVRLGYQWPSGWGIHARYFHVDGWEGGFRELGESEEFPIGFEAQMRYTSRIYSTEVNLHRRLGERFYVFSGFRWIELHEKVQARFDIWIPEISEVSLGMDIQLRLSNYLYGYQVGAEGVLGEYGRFQLEGAIRAGIYGGPHRGTATIQMIVNDIPNQVVSETVSDTKTFFVGELALLGKYRLGNHAIVYGGYQVMWIDGVALASQQQSGEEGDSFRSSTAFYHGPTVGLEIRW